ncbi:MAG: ABC transporter ATP-binding protein [Corynebacterium sp.]|nr:ABC transporter ATP-binding protein [Corynebacterium sp.]
MRSVFWLPGYKRLMGDEAWTNYSRGLRLGMLAGAVAGLALLVLLPASMSLETGQQSWGLGLRSWIVVLVVLAVAGAIIDFYGSRTSYKGILGFIKNFHQVIGDKVARLPLGDFKADTDGKLSRLVSQEMISLGESLSRALYGLLKDFSSSLVICIGAWLWSWQLGLLLTVAIPVLVLVLWGNRNLINAGKAISEPSENVLAQRIIEFSRSQGAIRSTGVGANYAELQEAFSNNLRLSRRSLWWETAGIVLSGMFAQAVTVGIILVAVTSVIAGSLSPLQGMVTIGMGLRFIRVLQDLGSAISHLGDRAQMLDQINRVMDAAELPEVSNSRPLTKPGTVALHHVSFGYEPTKPVLQDVSFTIEPGQMCAIVGPSGSGKTTIARLISRFYDVDAGRIEVGGVGVREQRIEDLMAQLSMVFQDVYLYDDTLVANIRVGDPQASEDKVMWAAQMAGVNTIAERLPQGWESPVGEGGSLLSGGEKQRVSIARALLKDAPIVLLDEATSALDVENELHIVNSMNRLKETSTLIVIAHKLETIKNADLVVVLGEDGHVEQTGTHDSLMSQEGRYRAFWEYSIQGKGWTLV